MSLDIGPHSFELHNGGSFDRMGQLSMMLSEDFRLVPHSVEGRLKAAFAEELVSFVESARGLR